MKSWTVTLKKLLPGFIGADNGGVSDVFRRHKIVR
jgi:hypothetical protein